MVAEAALELLDREGMEALSMRRLADELGVGTMTLYGYFRSKAELFDAVVDAAVPEDLELGSADGPWRDRIRSLVRAVRTHLERHPALVRIRVEQPVLRPEALRFAETGLAILLEAGFEPREATRAFRLLFTYTLGYTAFSPAEAVEQNREAARAAIASLSPGDYPALTSAGAEATDAMAGEETFDYGLERILDGLEASLAAGA